ncbi:uncharacterized protein vlc isoform X1 [Drosophila kikkawai]|uniref:Uncharacterized protein LOC108070935 isoform X2 n=3 Tax=Drosophila kikkawai TaxID=30033 RepID=A0A6P4HMW3_DROKI|nr:uncharacterized protein LOC108070935 isoform X2 [Drosophila kikkawai]
MDRSQDSIGSCSLDVDADSSDISDTSGSLNFPTPLSVKDITREFTANLRERCTLRSPPQTTTAYLDPGTGLVHMVLSPAAVESVHASSTAGIDTCPENAPGSAAVSIDAAEKKPSYLNLACCVNGYSNLTTYDSKIRQDINKSREVSPIRPSSSGLQYCKRNNSLAAPILHSMPYIKQPSSISKYPFEVNGDSNGHNQRNGPDTDPINSNGKDGGTSSFIQERVERLYGPGALAQGFYSPKKHGQSPSAARTSARQSSELELKFKQLSPSKDYGEFRKKLNNCSQAATQRLDDPPSLSSEGNGELDLPVFRHLSHEFRAQLPKVSPKRGATPRFSPAPEMHHTKDNKLKQEVGQIDEVDHQPLKQVQLETEEVNLKSEVVDAVKDGNYFLKILKDEQIRLLALAAIAEKYTDALANNPDITEDTFGLLRSASGKARLLVSQKMKQFEGLCHNNVNRSPEDEFPTTADDLQGFWDMVYLQVEHLDSIFADIEQLKANNWKRTVEPAASNTLPNKAPQIRSGALKSKSNTKASLPGLSASKNSAAALKRDAQRKQLLEMKRQRREAMAATNKTNHTVFDSTPEHTQIIGESSINSGDRNSS